jgi:hypothetical protein
VGTRDEKESTLYYVRKKVNIEIRGPPTGSTRDPGAFLLFISFRSHGEPGENNWNVTKIKGFWFFGK